MKKWFLRILFLVVAVSAILCCMGMEVNCDGEFQGFNCSFDGCGNSCNSCEPSCRHSYKVIEETESTCAESGYIKYECKKCGNIDTQYKQRPEHKTVFTFHKGTCDKIGGGDTLKYAWYDEERCTECDTVVYSHYYYRGSYGIHLYDEGVVAEEYESGCGKMVYTCQECGNEEISYFHSENSPQQKACNEAMTREYCNRYFNTCELCNKSVLGIRHNYDREEVLLSPTETEYGLKRKVCEKDKHGHCLYANSTVYYRIPPYGVPTDN